MDQVCHSQGKIKGKQYQTIWKNNNFLRSGNILASHAGVFRGARICSLPTNARSTENNIPFSLFYLRGK